MDDRSAETRTGAEASRSRVVLTVALSVLMAAFIALGTWQVKRLFWKLDLIARVDARVLAEPVPAPAQSEWPGISADKDEYRRVTAMGVFAHDKEALVQAVTERGAGFWVLTPMVVDDHTTILINRGFVPADRRDAAARPGSQLPGAGRVTGLLRMTEPDGGFLRSNDPATRRWYSRDVDAIARAQGLVDVAPYFIDADATPNPGGLPVGGLTVVNFRNSHLVYAATWYVLALMSAAGIVVVRRVRR
ncbi:SURF1 family protein [Ensifer sp. HO-A22]|uniref:SURF1-like protein n=1 Tax=Ensifer oleiphilus TaxID=2742698 RepID=A0A7Y6UNV3_9HYPH|nr:SURF1 family protein [Ensifer oleiphilus]NVD40547.1 SURF1 family protein [Ensifer oleiphilus]